MLNGSKKEPKGHICVWNANVCTKSKGKIWFGDIDLTVDVEDLKRLAAKEGEEVFVLREMDARFRNEAAPLFSRAVGRITPRGDVLIDQKAGLD